MISLLVSIFFGLTLIAASLFVLLIVLLLGSIALSVIETTAEQFWDWVVGIVVVGVVVFVMIGVGGMYCDS